MVSVARTLGKLSVRMVLLGAFAVFTFYSAKADVLDLNTALQNTYIACVGIDDSLADLKKMAGINTAVTAVGTATGGAATVVGLVKASKDKQIARLEKELEQLKEVTSNKPVPVPEVLEK